MQDIWDPDRRVEFAPLLEVAPEGHDRDGAKESLAKLFPATAKCSTSSDGGQLVRDREYSDRYFVRIVPQSDIADADIRHALTQAATPGAGSDPVSALLIREEPQRVDLGIRRMRTVWKEAQVHLDPVTLVTNLMSLWEPRPPARGPSLTPRQRLSF